MALPLWLQLYFFYLKYEKGPLYKPSSRDFELVLHKVCPTEAARLKAIWVYWEDTATEDLEAPEDELHPDHMPVHDRNVDMG